MSLDSLIRSVIGIKGNVLDGAPAVTDFDTNLPEATNDHYNGMLLLFVSGACLGQGHIIDDYVGASKNVSFAASDQWTDIPATGDNFLIIPMSGAYLKKIFDALTAGTYVGNLQMKPTTIDLNQIVGSYTLYTGTTQVVLLESFVIRMSGGAPGGALTGITVQTNDATPQIIIAAGAGLVANLTNEAQLSWNAAMGGPIYIKVGTLIRLTIVGGAAAAACVCNVVCECRAVVAGGTLA